MAYLHGHEAGNGGYGQGNPVHHRAGPRPYRATLPARGSFQDPGRRKEPLRTAARILRRSPALAGRRGLTRPHYAVPRCGCRGQADERPAPAGSAFGPFPFGRLAHVRVDRLTDHLRRELQRYMRGARPAGPRGGTASVPVDRCLASTESAHPFAIPFISRTCRTRRTEASDAQGYRAQLIPMPRTRVPLGGVSPCKRALPTTDSGAAA
jgi:hypothetical protein